MKLPKLFKVFVTDGISVTNAIVKAHTHNEARHVAQKALDLQMEIHILSKRERREQGFEFLQEPKVMEQINRTGGYIYGEPAK